MRGARHTARPPARRRHHGRQRGQALRQVVLRGCRGAWRVGGRARLRPLARARAAPPAAKGPRPAGWAWEWGLRARGSWGEGGRRGRGGARAARARGPAAESARVEWMGRVLPTLPRAARRGAARVRSARARARACARVCCGGEKCGGGSRMHSIVRRIKAHERAPARAARCPSLPPLASRTRRAEAMKDCARDGCRRPRLPLAPFRARRRGALSGRLWPAPARVRFRAGRMRRHRTRMPRPRRPPVHCASCSFALGVLTPLPRHALSSALPTAGQRHLARGLHRREAQVRDVPPAHCRPLPGAQRGARCPVPPLPRCPRARVPRCSAGTVGLVCDRACVIALPRRGSGLAREPARGREAGLAPQRGRRSSCLGTGGYGR